MIFHERLVTGEFLVARALEQGKWAFCDDHEIPTAVRSSVAARVRSKEDSALAVRPTQALKSQNAVYPPVGVSWCPLAGRALREAALHFLSPTSIGSSCSNRRIRSAPFLTPTAAAFDAEHQTWNCHSRRPCHEGVGRVSDDTRRDIATYAVLRLQVAVSRVVEKRWKSLFEPCKDDIGGGSRFSGIVFRGRMSEIGVANLNGVWHQ